MRFWWISQGLLHESSRANRQPESAHDGGCHAPRSAGRRRRSRFSPAQPRPSTSRAQPSARRFRSRSIRTWPSDGIYPPLSRWLRALGRRRGGVANPSINGASGLENQYIINGANVTDPGFGAFGTYNRNYGSLGNGVNFDLFRKCRLSPADLRRNTDRLWAAWLTCDQEREQCIPRVILRLFPAAAV